MGSQKRDREYALGRAQLEGRYLASKLDDARAAGHL